MKTTTTAFALMAALLPGSVLAQSSIQSVPVGEHRLEAYFAYIGSDDLYNSSGVRLAKPWQIIRQDRANYHRFGLVDRGDTGDTFFGSSSNREKMEDMLRRGWIDGQAAFDVVQGGALVLVEIYGRGSVGTSIHVSVAR